VVKTLEKVLSKLVGIPQTGTSERLSTGPEGERTSKKESHMGNRGPKSKKREQAGLRKRKSSFMGGGCASKRDLSPPDGARGRWLEKPWNESKTTTEGSIKTEEIQARTDQPRRGKTSNTATVITETKEFFR